MLNERGDIIFPADIAAETLDAAVRHAFNILHTSNAGASSAERVYGFEIWREPPAP